MRHRDDVVQKIGGGSLIPKNYVQQQARADPD